MPETWEQGLDTVMAELRALMIERHTKYGPENISAFGDHGCLVRASDKVARLRHGGGDMPDESVKDAWMDMANYGIIALMWRGGSWKLPAECLTIRVEGVAQ